MIAAQLLAYYFTELKDDQLKKVSGRRGPSGGRAVSRPWGAGGDEEEQDEGFLSV